MEEMKDEYEYGTPIPEQYRDRLYHWSGGGYDGCLWEPNLGMVDKEGHWHPLISTGYSGIDQREWYEGKIAGLKADLGYDVRNVDSQHSEVEHEAIEKVFGKKWYMVKGPCNEDARVKELMKKENERYAEFVYRRDGYMVEKTHRLDQMFMQVVQDEKDVKCRKFEEIGKLDDAHIKETCRKFCSDYNGNVGFMTLGLDRLANLGYEPWCTCSDCGEQFQRRSREEFGQSLDSEAYHGDGGLGVIMTRVLCDDCYENAECRFCYGLNMPNHGKSDHGAKDWGMYDFLACVIHAWIDVCWGCADGYEYEYLFKWNDVERQRFRTSLGLEYDKIEKVLSDANCGMKGHDLYVMAEKTPSGRSAINKIRDLLEATMREKFESAVDDDRFGDRLDAREFIQTDFGFE